MLVQDFHTAALSQRMDTMEAIGHARDSMDTHQTILPVPTMSSTSCSTRMAYDDGPKVSKVNLSIAQYFPRNLLGKLGIFALYAVQVIHGLDAFFLPGDVVFLQQAL